MTAQERLARVALGRQDGIGGRTIRLLLEEFGSAQAVLADAGMQPRLRRPVAAAIRDAAIQYTGLAEELADLEATGIGVAAWGDYPRALQAVADAPGVLYWQGAPAANADLTALPLQWGDDEWAVAIIGSRCANRSGQAFAQRLAREAVERGFAVVSGLAVGVDRAAHRGALSAGGRTLALPGCGLQRLPAGAPPELVADIRERGLLLSPFAPDTPVTAPQLLARNRVVTGLALVVFVIEASPQGGTLHAAAGAQAQSRVLYVADWRDDAPRLAGNRYLLARGARPLPVEGHLPWSNILDAAELAAAELAIRAAQSTGCG